MYLIKNKAGTYSPFDTSDHDASSKIAPGTVIKATQSRNYQFHKKAFALMSIAFDNQDKIASFEVYRKILTLKAGYYDEVPDKAGKPYFIPQSLSYDTMSADNFEKWYTAMLDVVATELSTSPESIREQIDSFY